jgi:hypothetical protein
MEITFPTYTQVPACGWDYSWEVSIGLTTGASGVLPNDFATDDYDNDKMTVYSANISHEGVYNVQITSNLLDGYNFSGIDDAIGTQNTEVSF